MTADENPEFIEITAEEALTRLQVGQGLSGFRLRGADFSGKQIRDWNFSGADLDGCKFDGASLEGCSFVGSRMTNISFTEASMTLTKFSKSRMEFAKFKIAKFNGCQFDDVNAYFSDFSGSKFVMSWFWNSELGSGTDMSGAIFVDCDFSRAKLWGVKFDESEFKKSADTKSPVGFSGVRANHASFRNAILNGCNFSSARLDDAVFDGVRFKGDTFFIDADCKRASFTGAKTEGGRLSFDAADLINARFEDAVISGGSFRATKVYGTSFFRSKIHKCDFTGATFGREEDILLLERAQPVPVDESLLRDMTEGAVFEGNEYGMNPVFPDYYKAPRQDVTMTSKKTLGITGNDIIKFTGSYSWDVMKLGVIWVGLQLGFDIETGTSAVLAAIFAAPLKYAEMKMSDSAESILKLVKLRIRNMASEFADYCRSSGVFVATAMLAVMPGSRAAAFRNAMRLASDTERTAGRLGFVKDAISGRQAVVVCDPDTLQAALAMAAVERNIIGGFKCDLTVILSGSVEFGPSKVAPTAIRFRRDGTSAALWTDNKGGMSVVEYNAHGNHDGPHRLASGAARAADLPALNPWYRLDGEPETDAGPDPNVWSSLTKTAIAFAKAHDSELVWSHVTHRLKIARDGSVMVVRNSDGKIDNPHGYAVYSKSRRSRFLGRVPNADAR